MTNAPLTHTNPYDDLRAVIGANCKGRLQFLDSKGRRCIFGEMLSAVGVPDDVLTLIPRSLEMWDAFGPRLQARWPMLNWARTTELVVVNDIYAGLGPRREVLTGVVTRWEQEDKAA